jgi:hypothetical protein
VYSDVTLCNECWRVIQPIWVLSANEKKKLQEEGRTFREIVFLNAEVTALQSQTPRYTQCSHLIFRLDLESTLTSASMVPYYK